CAKAGYEDDYSHYMGYPYGLDWW
nr:immunoglobulin heavy chain junction region [Macaca mulatta]MOY21778.1 immunoglobulin heavy chain junction region [Macaca mulatta]MOY22269.1 immunoglobulin heavy chain junction region [Macaca mulatta]MOY23033.1 immunoglobulin heavy chain junction region [Macaca mulatta]MOY25649.1 immunoglobulin heavy chain junction region [Macaca mulatta]